MRVSDSWYLCFRLFRREFFFYFLVLFVGVVTIGTIMESTSLYRTFVTQNFASKQPHFSISFNDATVSRRLNNESLIGVITKLDGVVAVSPYAKSISWGQFSASTTQLYREVASGYDKFSSGYFTVIGVEKASPSIVSWETINFYTSGAYKTKITNLELEYEWVTNPYLVIPNAVFDASFYPPISQEARIKNQFSATPWQVKGFIQDHHDDARIYVSRADFAQWLESKDSVIEKGIYIRMQEKYSLEQLRLSLENVCKTDCMVSAWLDRHERKRKVLTVFETFSWVTSLTISVLVFFLVGLYQAKSIIEKSRTINILHVTGYSFNKTVASIVLTITVCTFALFCFYVLVVFPHMAAWVSSSESTPYSVLLYVGGFCSLSSLFSICVFQFAINKVSL